MITELQKAELREFLESKYCRLLIGIAESLKAEWGSEKLDKGNQFEIAKRAIGIENKREALNIFFKRIKELAYDKRT